MPSCLKCGAELPLNEEGMAPVLCDRCAGRASSRARRRLSAGVMLQFPATSLLIGINTAVFLGMILSSGSLTSFVGFSDQTLLRWGGNVGPYTLSGEYWRLVTAGFVHANPLHFAMNMWCLWSLGQLSERLFGSSVTLAIYVLTGVGGAMLSVGLNPLRSEVGASAAVFGIAGAILSGIKFGNVPLASIHKRQIFSSLIFFVIFNLSFGMLPGIDNMAHLGGLISGFLFGAPLAAAAASGKKLMEWGTIVLAILVLTAAGSRVVQAHGHVSQLRVGGYNIHDRNYPAAISVLQRAAASEPGDARAHFLLGLAYRGNGQPDNANMEFERAEQLDPDPNSIERKIQALFGGSG
ncbi:MAG TPA: rhomboid family intramembrane serine protease [Candidatus Angelobacter sp.]|nr:rhomboid family intramembrane serine protease [Candidatus Angelobacter sp.]